MDIDFNNLSYKIPKPQIKLQNGTCYSYQNQTKIQIKHYIEFQDTQTSNYQQQTINPFRRTSHLFKHIQNEKKLSARTSIINKSNINYSNEQNKIQWSISSRSQPYLPIFPQQPTVYSLENFDSFKNNDSKVQNNVLKEINLNNRNKIGTSIKQSQFIKIQGSDYQQSDQFSLIMDDFNYQIKNSDIIPQNHSTRRIKTDYCQVQKQWEEDKYQKLCFDDKKSEKNVRKKQSSGIFFLTAQQQQSSELNVKQFYFDLRKQKEQLKAQQQRKLLLKENKSQDKSIKKSLKQLIYNFIDDLQIMNEDQIDPQFQQRIQKCLFTVKKIPPLHPPCLQITPQKWVKVNKKNSRSNSKQKIKFVPPKPVSSLQNANINRTNKQNTMFSKNINQSYKKKGVLINDNMSSLFHGEARKKRWML